MVTNSHYTKEVEGPQSDFLIRDLEAINLPDKMGVVSTWVTGFGCNICSERDSLILLVTGFR